MGGGSAHAADDDNVVGNDDENFDGRGGFFCCVDDDFLFISFVVKIVMSPNPRSLFADGSNRAFSSTESFDDCFLLPIFHVP